MSEKLRGGTNKAVEEINQRGIIDSMLVEARPIWSLPYQIVIGQVRSEKEKATFKWIICGVVPVDCVDSSVASTPREAARYFAMKWQLDAARYRDPSVQRTLGPEQDQSWDQLGETLAHMAEALYELVDADSHWRESDTT
jgi:hypothetical protein